MNQLELRKISKSSKEGQFRSPLFIVNTFAGWFHRSSFNHHLQMEMGIESATPKSDHVAGMALNIPVNDSNYATALFLPRRLRRRLLETKTPSIITAQDIETKLKDAELRRQVVILFLFVFFCSYYIIVANMWSVLLG